MLLKPSLLMLIRPAEGDCSEATPNEGLELRLVRMITRIVDRFRTATRAARQQPPTAY
jgi:hypothetical protein